MRPVLRHAALAATCVGILVLAGCGKHVASNAPITYAPADTPYLMANFKPLPQAAAEAWQQNESIALNIQQLGSFGQDLAKDDPKAAALLNALHDELADVKTQGQLLQKLGLSRTALFALYGIGDVPVARVQMASPDTFRKFWAGVEKRAGMKAPTATTDGQEYWVLGGDSAKLHVLVAIEGKQLVVTLAPANADAGAIKRLLGLTKPAKDASDRLARVNSDHGYDDYRSGYVDLHRLFAHAFDGKDDLTGAFLAALGVKATDPSCAGEFASLADQVPMASFGIQSFTAKEVRGSLDVQLSPSLTGALAALKQPVPGMAAKSDDSMVDLVLALPLKKWQAFLRERASAAAKKAYQCPALQPLNQFAHIAANPPVQMPPEAASLLGLRFVLDKWEAGPQIAGRMLVASSDPSALAKKLQQTMPQFALKTIPTDGKPVAFDLPSRMQAMLGGSNQGWIAADAHAIVAGVGDGEEAKLGEALKAPAGNGDRLMRVHLDGKMYGVLASWMGRVAAMAPGESQAQLQQTTQMLQELSKRLAAIDLDVTLDDKGLHMEGTTTHR